MLLMKITIQSPRMNSGLAFLNYFVVRFVFHSVINYLFHLIMSSENIYIDNLFHLIVFSDNLCFSFSLDCWYSPANTWCQNSIFIQLGRSIPSKFLTSLGYCSPCFVPVFCNTILSVLTITIQGLRLIKVTVL